MNKIMRTLTASEVKAMMDNNPQVQVVMTLSPAAFAKCHIPGSINIWDVNTAKSRFSPETPIILYCTDTTCMASYQAYHEMERAGYQKLWRFAGGLVAWAAAGYPLNQQPTSSNSALKEFLQHGNL